MRVRLIGAPWWVLALVTGVPFGRYLAVFNIVANDATFVGARAGADAVAVLDAPRPDHQVVPAAGEDDVVLGGGAEAVVARGAHHGRRLAEAGRPATARRARGRCGRAGPRGIRSGTGAIGRAGGQRQAAPQDGNPPS